MDNLDSDFPWNLAEKRKEETFMKKTRNGFKVLGKKNGFKVLGS